MGKLIFLSCFFFNASVSGDACATECICVCAVCVRIGHICICVNYLAECKHM